jgi:hypothetical protein
MRTRSGSLYSSAGVEAAVGQKRKRSAAWSGQPAVAAEFCSGGGRRKRLARGPDFLDVLPDDLVLSILSKVAASASAPSDLLSVHLTYVVAFILLPPWFIITVINPILSVCPAIPSSCFNGLQTNASSPRTLAVMRGGTGAVCGSRLHGEIKAMKDDN